MEVESFRRATIKLQLYEKEHFNEDFGVVFWFMWEFPVLLSVFTFLSCTSYLSLMTHFCPCYWAIIIFSSNIIIYKWPQCKYLIIYCIITCENAVIAHILYIVFKNKIYTQSQFLYIWTRTIISINCLYRQLFTWLRENKCPYVCLLLFQL